MRRLLLVTVLVLGGNAARADHGSFYFGAGVTTNQLNDIVVPGTSFPHININSTSWTVFAGFRPISLFAVEVDYLDLGSHTNFLFGNSFDIHSHSDAKAFAG